MNSKLQFKNNKARGNSYLFGLLFITPRAFLYKEVSSVKAILMITGVMGYLVLLALLVLRAEATESNLRFIVYGIVGLLYVAIIIIGIKEKRRINNEKIK